MTYEEAVALRPCAIRSIGRGNAFWRILFLIGHALTVSVVVQIGEARSATDNNPASLLNSIDSDRVNQRAQRLATEAKAAYAKGEFGAAVKLFTELLVLKPADIRILFNRGLAYRKLGDEDKSFADFSMALRMDPWFTPALVNRARILQSRGALPDAIADLNKAIERNPEDAGLWHERGRLSANLGRSDDALRDFNEAVSRAPGYVSAYVERGLLLLLLKRHLEAKRDLDTALRIESGNVRALSGLELLRREWSGPPTP